MIALDAGVLIAHFTPNDVHHAAAVSGLRSGARAGMALHPMTAAEILVDAVRTGRVDVIRARLRAMGIGVGRVDDDAPLRLAEWRVRTRMKLPDCCVLGVAGQHGAELATFDEPLAAAARSLGIPVLGAGEA